MYIEWLVGSEMNRFAVLEQIWEINLWMYLYVYRFELNKLCICKYLLSLVCKDNPSRLNHTFTFEASAWLTSRRVLWQVLCHLKLVSDYYILLSRDWPPKIYTHSLTPAISAHNANGVQVKAFFHANVGMAKKIFHATIGMA